MDSADRDQLAGQIIADYLRATERGENPDRAALLAANPELAGELQTFFANHDRMQSAASAALEMQRGLELEATLAPGSSAALLTSSNGGTTDRPPRERIGYFGDYELLEEIARGGMGVVYKARQVNLNRVVALKMILAGQLAGEADVKRFHAEAESAARLDHPNIVPIFEVGEHHGRHYFSMGYVEGQSLADRIAAGPRPPDEAAALVKTLAEAIQYAHGKGVIHRDLKPANVLLEKKEEGGSMQVEAPAAPRTKQDASTIPRITDFGLAKKLGDDSGLTTDGQILGTPAYMPPEQAAGRLDEVTETADVYSLGAILYCLLVGRPPFQAANPIETIHQVLADEPPPPRRLNPAVPLDLETICLKCLEKERSKRYASAQELADELGRYAHGEPILARPISRFEHAWRWCQRNPIHAGFWALCLLVLVALGIGGPILAAQQWELARNEAQLRKQTADALQEAKKERNEAQQQRDLAEERLARSQRLVYASQTLQAQREWEGGNYGSARDTLQLTQPDLRGWEYDYLLELFNRNHKTLTGHADGLWSVAVSPDGKRIASSNYDLGGGSDNTLRIWDAETGQQLRQFDVKSNIKPLLFSSDGRHVIGATGDFWDLESGEVQRRLKRGYGALSRDGTRAANAQFNGPTGPSTSTVWDTETGVVLRTFEGQQRPTSSLAFSPDGKLLASGSWVGVVIVWNIETGDEVHNVPAHKAMVSHVVFSPDGKSFATCSRDKDIKIWDTASGKELRALKGHKDEVYALAFRPDGKQLASGSLDKTLRLWDLETGKEFVSLVGHDSWISDLAYTPDGHKVVTCSPDKTIKIWRADGIQIARTLQNTRTLPADNGRIDTLLFTPDGNRVIRGGGDYTDGGETGNVKIWDIHTGKEVHAFAGYGRLVAVSPVDDLVASAGFSGEMRIWNARTGKTLFDFPNGHLGVHALAFSPDGKRLVTGGDGTLQLWDVEKGQQLQDLERLSERVYCVAYSPDGKAFVTAGGNHHLINPELILWDAYTGRRKKTLAGHEYTVTYAAFHPNGKVLATASRDKLIKIWDVETGKELTTLKGHTHWVTKVIYSPDGSRLFSNGIDGTTRVWDPQSGSEVLTLSEVRGAIALSPDGRTLVGSDRDGILKVLEILQVNEGHIENAGPAFSTRK